MLSGICVGVALGVVISGSRESGGPPGGLRMKTVKVGSVGGLMLILLGVGAGVPTDASAQTLTTLYSFPGPLSDGAELRGGLIADAAGNLYGTTFGGGSGNGYGTVFKLTPMGTEIVLHRFTGDDGAGPA